MSLPEDRSAPVGLGGRRGQRDQRGWCDRRRVIQDRLPARRTGLTTSSSRRCRKSPLTNDNVGTTMTIEQQHRADVAVQARGIATSSARRCCLVADYAVLPGQAAVRPEFRGIVGPALPVGGGWSGIV